LYNLGNQGGEHGVPVYMNAIRVLEEAPQEVTEGVDF
jgi:hypothetical protein